MVQRDYRLQLAGLTSHGNDVDVRARRVGTSHGKAPGQLANRAPLFLLLRKSSFGERATGLEPATSSLGSWHSTN